MAIGDLVIFNGEGHYIVGEALMETLQDNDQSIFNVILSIHRVEHASLQDITRAIWVKLEEVIPLVSAISFQKTEWFMGVYGGK